MKTLWLLITISTCTSAHNASEWAYTMDKQGFINIVHNVFKGRKKMHEHREFKDMFSTMDELITSIRTHAPAELESGGYVALEATLYVIQSSTTIKLIKR